MVNYDISFCFSSTQCTISNLKLTKDEKFEPPRESESITKLTINGCTIPRLTEDLIGAFANLEVLWAENSGIEEVSEEAFVGCKNLKEIHLGFNKIKALEPNTFNRNTKLEKLLLHNNQLDFLPKELFLNLENLKVLIITTNNLTSLPMELFTNLKNLEEFFVIGNQLTDVKIEEILKQCPRLKWFGIRDNDFSRAVLENIQKHLKDASVGYNTCLLYQDTVRSRPYATQKLDGVEYIPDEEYERLLAKKENVKKEKNEKLWQEKFDLMEEKFEKKIELMQLEIKILKNSEKLLQKKVELIEEKFEKKQELLQREMETMKVRLQQLETSGN